MTRDRTWHVNYITFVPAHLLGFCCFLRDDREPGLAPLQARVRLNMIIQRRRSLVCDMEHGAGEDVWDWEVRGARALVSLCVLGARARALVSLCVLGARALVSRCLLLLYHPKIWEYLRENLDARSSIRLTEGKEKFDWIKVVSSTSFWLGLNTCLCCFVPEKRTDRDILRISSLNFLE